MFILEERYGNDGYAFWFKILETLGHTQCHFIDLNKESELEYLRSKTRCDEDKITEILNLLARLEAIDPVLWENKIIWSQNFVDGISDVYTRSRHTLPPSKPDNYALKPHATNLSTQICPQSKVKESKVKESKVIHRGLFRKPSLEEVSVYCLERNKGIDPEAWINHYTSNGWMVGKNKMKDWKAAVRTWEAKKKERDNGNRPGNPGGPGETFGKAKGDGTPYPVEEF
jgi:hypothetical protein